MVTTPKALPSIAGGLAPTDGTWWNNWEHQCFHSFFPADLLPTAVQCPCCIPQQWWRCPGSLVFQQVSAANIPRELQFPAPRFPTRLFPEISRSTGRWDVNSWLSAFSLQPWGIAMNQEMTMSYPQSCNWFLSTWTMVLFHKVLGQAPRNNGQAILMWWIVIEVVTNHYTKATTVKY